MPGTDLAYDETGDFVDDGAGDWLEDATLAPLCRHQVLDDQGLFFADVDAGSAAWTVPPKLNRTNVNLRADAIREALQVLVDEGLAEDLALDVAAVGNRFEWEGSLVDVQHGRLDLSPLLSYGVDQER